LEPFRGLDIQDLEEHIKDDFLNESSTEIPSSSEIEITRVSREGIRRVSTRDRIASISSMQKYIRPDDGCGVYIE
jgi:hypothetical protein